MTAPLLPPLLPEPEPVDKPKAKGNRSRPGTTRPARRKDKPADGMNDLERKYSRHLDERKSRGEIAAYLVHPVELIIIEGKPGSDVAKPIKKAVYIPDFLVIENDGAWSFHETKGFLDLGGDGWLKFKAATSRFPWPFYMVQWKRGEWQIERYGQ